MLIDIKYAWQAMLFGHLLEHTLKHNSSLACVTRGDILKQRRVVWPWTAGEAYSKGSLQGETIEGRVQWRFLSVPCPENIFEYTSLQSLMSSKQFNRPKITGYYNLLDKRHSNDTLHKPRYVFKFIIFNACCFNGSLCGNKVTPFTNYPVLNWAILAVRYRWN